MAKFLDNSFLRSSENHWSHQRADQRGSPAHKLSPGSEPAETDSLDGAHKCIKLGRMSPPSGLSQRAQTEEKRRREDGIEERWEVSPTLPLGGQARTCVRSWGTNRKRQALETQKHVQSLLSCLRKQPPLLQCFLCSFYWVKHITHITDIFTTTFWGRYDDYTSFTDEKTESQRSQLPSPR